MIQRTTNPNDPEYSRYGARGIKVCEQWRVFANFVADMGDRPAGHQIDRMNNDSDYAPENCRWATPTQQANNRRSTRKFTINNVTKTFAEWMKDTNLKRSTVYQRFYGYGWPIEKALNTPVAGYPRERIVR